MTQEFIPLDDLQFDMELENEAITFDFNDISTVFTQELQEIEDLIIKNQEKEHEISFISSTLVCIRNHTFKYNSLKGEITKRKKEDNQVALLWVNVSECEKRIRDLHSDLPFWIQALMKDYGFYIFLTEEQRDTLKLIKTKIKTIVG